jgi:hypothetical protein
MGERKSNVAIKSIELGKTFKSQLFHLMTAIGQVA